MMTRDDIPKPIADIIEGFGRPSRSPILRTPGDEGLAFEDIWFPSEDGTPLEAWYIPREGSDRLIIANHPMTFSRYGYPAHLSPWDKGFGDFGGNDFEVNFIPDYRILHEHGYNVLTYDHRNFGHSASANGRVQSGGIFESRDAIGAQRYVKGRADLRDMKTGLFSRCMGANASIMGMACQRRRKNRPRGGAKVGHFGRRYEARGRA